MQVYLDTSVILPYWISHEINHQKTKILFDSQEMEFKGIISGLVLSEIASVVERQSNKFEIDNDRNLAIEYVRAVLQLEKVTLVDPDINNSSKLLTYPIYTKAIELAPIFRLKSLDNLHLAIISQLKNQLHQIDAFITGDREILEKHDLIMKNMGLRVMNSTQFFDELRSP